MKRLKVAGLCLVSMLVAGMALAGNASAALLWLLCLPQTGGTERFADNQCTEKEAGGAWESVSLGTKSDTVRLLAFSLLLSDPPITVHCPDVSVNGGWGLIEKNKLIVKIAEVPKPKEEGCKVEGSLLTCKEGALEKVSAVNLPWTAEMFETEKKNLAQIVGSGGKPPGWAITCGGVTDTCTESSGKPEFLELLNGVTKKVLLVLARLTNKGRADCTVGGKEKGQVKGLIAILLWNGNGLSINPV
jgi:hypothetical protein